MTQEARRIGAVIGIDLGTTRSGAAYVDPQGHATCLPNRDGELLTPSCVAFDAEGVPVVGRPAQSCLTQAPDRAIEAFKRHMGDAEWSFHTDGRAYRAEDLSAILLTHLRADVERVIGPIAGAVITVPAYFGDGERAATLRAAQQAGLPVLDIINEPTAAAIAGAFDAYVAAGGDAADATRAAIAATAPGVNVICDLGGGTFDVTVIRVDGTDFDVLASNGCRLGGRDFDEVLVEAMYRHLFDCDAPDPHHDPRAQARMRIRAESAKHVLTVDSQAPVDPPYEGLPALALTRERFEAMSERLVDRAREVITDVMADAALTWPEVEEVMLVGGASRMPMIRRMVAQLSGKKPGTRLQPDLIIAQGAAVYAAILRLQSAPLLQPATYGIAELDEICAEPATSVETAFAPHFAAAAGRVRVREVAPRSLGVVVRSPRASRKINRVLIRKNQSLPAGRSHLFATRFDDQRKVVVPIVEGESKDPRGCIEVGRCVIDALPPNLPKGSRVEVSFNYDRSGLVHVRAEERSTGTAAETTLHRNAGGETTRRSADAPDSPLEIGETTPSGPAETAPHPGAGKPPTQLDELARAVARFAGD